MYVKFVFHASLHGGLEPRDIFPWECVCLGVRVVVRCVWEERKEKGCWLSVSFSFCPHIPCFILPDKSES